MARHQAVGLSSPQRNPAVHRPDRSGSDALGSSAGARARPSVLSRCEDGGTVARRDPDFVPQTGQNTSDRYRVASLFSGIGGFDLGFERAKFEITFQCEIEPFCQDVLHQYWPKVPRASDIKELTSADVPVSDVWVAGFPCQDVSLARMGKRPGLRGSKSGLFHEFARLVGEGRPRLFVIENVPGLLSSHGGRDFGTVLGTLAELGYSLGWRLLDSKDFGVPQSRNRVFVVGSDRDWGGPPQILFEPERSTGVLAQNSKNGTKTVSPFARVIEHPGPKRPVTKAIAYCLYAESARHTGTDWSRNYVCYPEEGSVRRLTPAECEGVMAFPPGWTDLHATLEGEALDTARYHALGNAVTPPVAEWLANRIKLYLSQEDEFEAEHAPDAVAVA
ncbi:MAG: DNA (cytosine-5-)-methyltransferase [Solirubrobacteraceae bacterium]